MKMNDTHVSGIDVNKRSYQLTTLVWLARKNPNKSSNLFPGITERRGTCKDEGKEKVVKVSHHVQLPRGNENLLKEWRRVFCCFFI